MRRMRWDGWIRGGYRAEIAGMISRAKLEVLLLQEVMLHGPTELLMEFQSQISLIRRHTSMQEKLVGI